MWEPIVSIEVDDNFIGVSEVDGTVEVGKGADPFCVADESDFVAPSLFVDVSSDELSGSVRGVVIDIDYAEVGIILSEDGVEVVFVPLAVVIGCDNEDK